MAETDSDTVKAIATAAFLVALIAAMISLFALNKSKDALDRANQTINNQRDTDAQDENLMRGTGQEEVLPPTEPPTQ